MIIVDTTVWIDYLRGSETLQTLWLDRNLESQRLGLTDLILCEVLQGIRDDEQFERTSHELLNFEIYTTGGIDLAVKAARNFRALRLRGKTIRKTIDCLIATFCLQNGYSLLHNDSDFIPFEETFGLSVIHP